MPEASPPETSRPLAAMIVFVLLLVGSLTALLYVLSSFATDAVLGLLLAALSRPAYLALVRRGQAPWLAASLITAAVGIAIALPTSFLVTSLTRQAARAYAVTTQSLSAETLNEALFGDGFWARELRAAFEALGMEYSSQALRQSLGELARAIASRLSGELNRVLSNIFAALYHFILVLVIVYYGLLEGPNLKQRIFDLSPLPDDEEQLIVDKFADVGKAIFFGNGIGSVLQGLLGGLSMWACGLSSCVFWGTVMTLFAFLPLAGISIVVVPVALYLGLSGHWGVAVVFLGFNLVQAVVIENVVKTKLIGDRMHMHGGLIFFSLLGGLSMFGILGILYGPLIVALFMTVNELYERAYKARLLSR